MGTFRFTSIAITLGAVAAASGVQAQRPQASRAAATAPDSAFTIHQEVDLSASPARVYEALMDAGQFTAFSGRPAVIDRAVGGAFSLFGGHIVGRNLELVPSHRIVQAWRVVDWPDGVYSIARFELLPHGSGTRVVLEHTGFPERLHDHLAAGWQANYWTLLSHYLH